MRQMSRRGVLGWFAQRGLLLASAGGLASLGLAATPPQQAEAAGCPECWGDCHPCVSCCARCSVSCCHYCTYGCFGCLPVYARSHLMWILGYIPNCTWVACT